MSAPISSLRLDQAERDGNPNPKLFFGSGGDLTEPFGVYGVVTVRAAIAGATKGARYQVILGQAWVSSLYAAWEHHFRATIAKAVGVLQPEVMSDIMGDLRLIRHDIEHELGIATRANSGRCVRHQWTAVDQSIEIGLQEIKEFMQLIEPEIAAWRLRSNQSKPDGATTSASSPI